MAKLTINETLSLCKAVRERVNGLNRLRSEVSKKETLWGEKERTIEPQYDVKLVDRKIVELEKFLYQADARIKQSNALTTVEVDATVDSLLNPIE